MPIYNTYWIANPDLRDAIEHFLGRKREPMEYKVAVLDKESPLTEGYGGKSRSEEDRRTFSSSGAFTFANKTAKLQ